LQVLQDVNFRMNEGEIVAILGKSGSGKSTLLRIIAGLVQPTEGTVNYRGKPVLFTCSWYLHGFPEFCFVAVADCFAKC